MFDQFTTKAVEVSGHEIFCRIGGAGPPLLLLHGFPETHLMWREVAPRLALRFTVVAADLPGYGASGCPPSDAEHSPYSKRAMANALAGAMARLGFPSFALAGHDRGGRVAYRLALDYPDRVTSLAVLDAIPITDAWAMADSRLTLSFWPWSLLAQPAPLPERLIAGAPDAIIDDAATQWGSAASTFPPEIRAAYAEQLRDPDRAHAICEEFRSAATVDREHDDADRLSGRRICCPLLVLWDGQGALGRWYEERGGPLAIWRTWAGQVEGQAMQGGHFFPEEHPVATADRIERFLRGLHQESFHHGSGVPSRL